MDSGIKVTDEEENKQSALLPPESCTKPNGSLMPTENPAPIM